MPLNLDTSFFSVVCELGGDLYVPETDLQDMTWKRIVADIRSGQFERVKAVLEFNPAEGWCNDVTGDVMTAAFPAEEVTATDRREINWSDYRSECLDGRLAGVAVTVAA
ncbi:hypothetical protein [Roseibium sp.]|uniref:hypothetical protein n=1 Tax=Roseibium sp. TaxID=1936156 RepID=UPI003D0A73C2